MTITNDLLKLVIKEQHNEPLLPENFMVRSAQTKLDELKRNKEIIVLTGVRRCGKSVLLQNIRAHASQSDYYLNFEDERLVNFTLQDFQKLVEIFIELYGEQKTFYFDEIQNIEGWELFVRRIYNSGNKIYISGSNANLFSEELGTRLTGRYISLAIYPISFKEYVVYKNKSLSQADVYTTKELAQLNTLFNEYNRIGGIPEYIKYTSVDYLHSLYESILYKDIVARYKIVRTNELKKLLFFLASNCAKEVTYTSLRKMLGLKSSTTVSDYCSYIQNSYLCFFVNRYSDSIKAQEQSAKKVYFIDHVIAKILGFRISEDKALLLENIVYIELRRRNHNIYYFKETKGCDFVIREAERTIQVIQVCREMSDPNTKKREYSGLIEAMQRFNLDRGLIITESENYTETITLEDSEFTIEVVAAANWLMNP